MPASLCSILKLQIERTTCTKLTLYKNCVIKNCRNFLFVFFKMALKIKNFISKLFCFKWISIFKSIFYSSNGFVRHSLEDYASINSKILFMAFY